RLCFYLHAILFMYRLLFLFYFYFNGYCDLQPLHSFPTRRSSDLKTGTLTKGTFQVLSVHPEPGYTTDELLKYAAYGEIYSNHPIDRKSTRLNSSHVSISYAVFCLKKKIKNKIHKSTAYNNEYNKM